MTFMQEELTLLRDLRRQYEADCQAVVVHAAVDGTVMEVREAGRSSNARSRSTSTPLPYRRRSERNPGFERARNSVSGVKKKVSISPLPESNSVAAPLDANRRVERQESAAEPAHHHCLIHHTDGSLRAQHRVTSAVVHTRKQKVEETAAIDKLLKERRDRELLLQQQLHDEQHALRLAARYRQGKKVGQQPVNKLAAWSLAPVPLLPLAAVQ